jgi:hypothetical protein
MQLKGVVLREVLVRLRAHYFYLYQLLTFVALVSYRPFSHLGSSGIEYFSVRVAGEWDFPMPRLIANERRNHANLGVPAQTPQQLAAQHRQVRLLDAKEPFSNTSSYL